MPIYTFEETYLRVLTLLRRSNMITMIDMDDKVRLGMYYLMKIYGLGFRHRTWGSWEWVELCKGEDGNGLTAKDIEEMEPDMKIYYQLQRDHNAGRLPNMNQSTDNKPKIVSTTYKPEFTQEFGWLSPTGDFTESEWGHHLPDAEKIIKEKGWQDEFDVWYDEHECMTPENDFLCQVKGYVLIHNPSLDGGYVVTNIKPLTKKQREFLYQYFYDMGNHLRAERYLNEEE